MAFDSIDRLSAPLCYPIGHHSRAGATGAALSAALRIGYLCGRRDHQLLITQTYGFSHQNETLDVVAGMTAKGTGYQALGGGWAYVPALATHIVAVAAVALMGADPQTYTQRVTATTGTPDEGGAVTTPASLGTGAAYPNWNGEPFDSAFPGNQLVRCEVALANVTPPATPKVIIEGYSVGVYDGLARVIWPQLVAAWWECRG